MNNIIIIILISIILIIIAFYFGRKCASKPIENKNEEIRKEQELLSQNIQTLTIQQKEEEKKLNEIRLKIKNQQQSLISAEQKNQWIEKQYQERLSVIANTEELAQKAYDDKIEILNQKYKESEKEYQLKKSRKQEEIDIIQEELDSLKATKAAAIAAAQKERLVSENKNQYCLILPKDEKKDIPILQDVQYKISKPRAVGMCIWSNYFLPIAKEKFPKILGKQDVCGIYKITNQKTGECYIGQARDCKKRWYEHGRCGVGVDTPQGNQLYKAMMEDGLENFSFELIEECSPEELNQKEKYFISFYSSDTLGYNINKGAK